MEKQKITAVEWLESRLTIYCKTIYREEIKKAKEMEKEQITDAFTEGYEERYQQDVNSEKPFFNDGLDYYLKTFNK